jgi:hypothetical protein
VNDAIYTPLPGDERYCAGCTLCCRWPGDVLFEPSQLPAIAVYLEMDERDCAETFFDVTAGRAYLKTKQTEHGGCIFLTDAGCSIYPHRPLQCRTFPYTWRRDEDELMRECALYQSILARNGALRDPAAWPGAHDQNVKEH